MVSALRKALMTKEITSCLHMSQLLILCFSQRKLKICTAFHVCSRVKHLLDVLKPKAPICISSTLCSSPFFLPLPQLCLLPLCSFTCFCLPLPSLPFSYFLAKLEAEKRVLCLLSRVISELVKFSSFDHYIISAATNT